MLADVAIQRGAVAVRPDHAVMIDLGEIPKGAGTVPVASRTIGTRWRRAILLGVLAVVSFAIVAASGTVAPGPLVVTARVPFGGIANVLVVGRHAIVADDRSGVGQINSYALPGGRPEWTDRVNGIADSSQVLVKGTTMVAAFPGTPGSAMVEAFDLDTGRVLWQRSAAGIASVPGGIVIFADRGNFLDVSLVDPATGAADPTYEIPAGCDTEPITDVAGNATDSLLSVCPDTGDLSVIDLTTGRVRASRNLHTPPIQGSTGAAVPGMRLIYAGPVTLIGLDRGRQFTVSAFRSSDLAPLAVGTPSSANDQFRQCGLDLCLSGIGQNGIIVDPFGAVSVLRPATRPLVGDSTALLLVQDGGDYATMRAGDLPADDTPVAAGESVQIVGDIDGGAMWIATGSASSVRLVQQLHGVEVSSCMSISGYIACVTSPGQLTFWQRP
jgi:putative pyrroloquinoline-quinone binding quinoprotein